MNIKDNKGRRDACPFQILYPESRWVPSQEELGKKAYDKFELMPFDTIVASQEEFDFYKDQINTIYFEADKRGILIYERN